MGGGRPGPVAGLAEAYMARTIKALLDLVELEFEPAEAAEKGAPPGPHHQELRRIRRFCGPLNYIACYLGALARLFSPASSSGDVVGFRLRRLEDWTGESANGPRSMDPYREVLQYLSHPCGASCVFCVHDGDPPGHFTRGRRWQVPHAELMTRLKFYRPGEGRALPCTSDLHSFEITTHPLWHETLAHLRRKTGDTFIVVTNGFTLDEAEIRTLGPFGPFLFVVSVNESVAARRAQVMGHRARRAPASIVNLHRARLPFIASITPALGTSAEEIVETVRYVDQFSPYLIRLNLPGRTRFHRGGQGDMRRHWRTILAAARRARGKTRSAVVIQPLLYLENHLLPRPMAAVLAGTVPGSPAERAGLLCGDEVTAIEGRPVSYREVARGFLASLARAGRGVTVRIVRGGSPREVSILPDGGDCPYRAVGAPFDSSYPFGMVLTDGLAPRHWKAVLATVAGRGAEKTLLLTGELMLPTVGQFMREFGCGGTAMYCEAVPNTSFLGGDILPADLLVVDDFIAAARGFMNRTGVQPDLILVPGTAFSVWGFDISGRPFADIGRNLGIPVATITGRRALAIG
ncbi:MAG: PDZ domain-containing protein [Acetobacteraceae bacterium]|nr:PDZ domain-containing protein [Acetobacteraceae bacterium]